MKSDPTNLSCSEIDCSSVVHARFINNLCNAVVNTCIHCSKLCIPLSIPNRERSTSIPYWKDNCSVLLFVIVEGGSFIIIYHSIIIIYDL